MLCSLFSNFISKYLHFPHRPLSPTLCSYFCITNFELKLNVSIDLKILRVKTILGTLWCISLNYWYTFSSITMRNLHKDNIFMWNTESQYAKKILNKSEKLSRYETYLAEWAKLPSWWILCIQSRILRQIFSEPLMHALSPVKLSLKVFFNFI